MRQDRIRTDEPRAPRQSRSQKRVDQILATAQEIIAEKGCANLAMTEIAARAGITAGSMYQYFVNKSAIVAALAEGYLTSFGDHLVATLEAARDDGRGVDAVTGVIGDLLQSYESLHRTDPVARDVLAGFAADKTLQALDAALTEALLDRIVQVFLSMGPQLDPTALRMQVRLLLQYADVAVRVAQDRPGPERDAILRLAGENLGVLWQDFCRTAQQTSSGPASLRPTSDR
ncbi:MAG: TetR/AcrR family transcriptional regulator [Rhodobacteraceae bacterium]|jgi:AcrR family transcriptional regulator|nr:TetR/AcrR family transcriptional regulator [Paracoccaceae bacterium]